MRILTRLTSYAQTGDGWYDVQRLPNFIASFRQSGRRCSHWVTSMEANKMQSMLTIHFVGNLLRQNFGNTGAFEIYYDGEEVLIS